MVLILFGLLRPTTTIILLVFGDFPIALIHTPINAKVRVGLKVLPNPHQLADKVRSKVVLKRELKGQNTLF